jgi:hypothetical protein
MNDLNRRHHWEKVYATKGESEVSWFQETPACAVVLVRQDRQRFFCFH